MLWMHLSLHSSIYNIVGKRHFFMWQGQSKYDIWHDTILKHAMWTLEEEKLLLLPKSLKLCVLLLPKSLKLYVLLLPKSLKLLLLPKSYSIIYNKWTCMIHSLTVATSTKNITSSPQILISNSFLKSILSTKTCTLEGIKTS